MEILAMGSCLAFNIIIILWKLNNKRKINGLLDLLLLVVVMYMTAGTLTGMLVGSMASFFVSFYLLWRSEKERLFNFIKQKVRRQIE